MKKRITVSLLLCCMLCITVFGAMGGESKMQAFSYSSSSKDLIQYSRKEDNTHFFDGTIGSFTYYGNNNACGPVAGAVALSFFDRIYSNLIPNFEPTYIYNNKLYSSYANASVDNVIEQLITSMNCTSGVTVSKFQSGLTSYVKSKGLNISYTSNMSTFLIFFKNFTYSKYKSSIDAGQPVILCVDGFHIASIGTSGNTDSQNYMYSKNCHAMVGFGYRTIKYFRNETNTVWSPVWYNPFRTVSVTEEVNFRNDTFLMVETGQSQIGYVNLDKSLDIFDAFSVNIYR